jgi:excinuclease ABC subunit C
MHDAQDTVIYVGKARNLKKRLASYFQKTSDHPKTRRLVSEIARIDLTVTASEIEALLLEQNLIKAFRPKYNVLLRDDKSYPYIHLSDGDFPRVNVHRGSKRKGGQYFGPYPSAKAVRDTLALLQKLFKVRQCEDSVFAHRTRPCLQYQIGRCKGPCVGLVDAGEYQRDVALTEAFLQGDVDRVLQQLTEQMEACAANQAFEEAAVFRDQIRQIRHVTSHQAIESGAQDADVFAMASGQGIAVVHALFVRQGRLIGSRNMVLGGEVLDAEDGLRQFICQFYTQGREVPPTVVVDPLGEATEAVQALLSNLAGRKVQMVTAPRGIRQTWKAMAARNAENAWQLKLKDRLVVAERLESLARMLGLREMPQRLECIDISHHQGEETRASCVVFGPQGVLKNEYRQYRITTATPGDDYAAIRETVERRLSERERALPDVLLIDGGRGQLAQAEEAVADLKLENKVLLLAISKGSDRRAGQELIWRSGYAQPLRAEREMDGFHLLLQVRDEAHRFAVNSHRNARKKKTASSPLENVPGIGPKKRARLLRRFGGLSGLRQASMEDLVTVPGIGRKQAQAIIDYLQS